MNFEVFVLSELKAFLIEDWTCLPTRQGLLIFDF